MYEPPKSEVADLSKAYPAKANKFLRYAIGTFLVNCIAAVITITTRHVIEPQATLYLAYCWMVTTVLYGVACAFFFNLFGKHRWLWGVVIVVSQPIGVLVSIVVLIVKGFRNAWYKTV